MKEKANLSNKSYKSHKSQFKYLGNLFVIRDSLIPSHFSLEKLGNCIDLLLFA